MRPGVVLAAVATLAAATCAIGVRAESTSGQASRPLLAASNNGGVYSVEPSGANQVELFPCRLRSPALSPDGRTYLAEAGSVGIYRLPVAEPVAGGCTGSALAKLSDSYLGLEGWSPRWAPSGRRFLFIDAQASRVATATASGSGKRLIGPRDVLSAAWSPNGKKIVLARRALHDPCPNRKNNPYCQTSQIMVMNANGSNLRALFTIPREKPLRKFIAVFGLDWSPKGAILMNVVTQGLGISKLAVINADGSGYRDLTAWPQRALHGVWSPTGKQIAFTVLTTQGGGVFLMTPKGKVLRKVTTSYANKGLDW